MRIGPGWHWSLAVIARWSKLGGKTVIVSFGLTGLIVSWLKFKSGIFLPVRGELWEIMLSFLSWGYLHPSFYSVWDLHDSICCLSIMYSLYSYYGHNINRYHITNIYFTTTSQMSYSSQGNPHLPWNISAFHHPSTIGPRQTHHMSQWRCPCGRGAPKDAREIGVTMWWMFIHEVQGYQMCYHFVSM